MSLRNKSTFERIADFISQHRSALTAYLLVTITAAVFITVELVFSDGVLSRDGCKYLLYVTEALNNSWAAAAEKDPGMSNYPPLLVTLMYLAGKLGIDQEIAGRVLNLSSVFFMSWGILYCCRKLYKDKFAALCSALMLVAIPKIYLVGCNILRDPLYWAETVWALALMLNLAENAEMPLKKYLRNLLGMSLLLALACLTRKEGMFFTALFLLWLVTLNPASWQRKLWSAALLLAIVAVFIFIPHMLGVPWDITEIIFNFRDAVL